MSLGRKLDEELSDPFDKSCGHKNALSFSLSSSLSKWQLFRACMSRELLLMRRNSFVYVFKTTQVTWSFFPSLFAAVLVSDRAISKNYLLPLQLVFTALITMTVFLRTRMSIDVFHANYYMGSLFYALVILVVDGIPELSMTVSRLAVFYKQKELCFYPAWAYAIPASILKLPLSLLESVVWTSLTYYVIGYTPQAGRWILVQEYQSSSHISHLLVLQNLM